MRAHGLKEAGRRSGLSLERRRSLQSSQGMLMAGNALRCHRERRDARREQAALPAAARRRAKGEDEACLDLHRQTLCTVLGRVYSSSCKDRVVGKFTFVSFLWLTERYLDQHTLRYISYSFFLLVESKTVQCRHLKHGRFEHFTEAVSDASIQRSTWNSKVCSSTPKILQASAHKANMQTSLALSIGPSPCLPLVVARHTWLCNAPLSSALSHYPIPCRS